MSRAFVIKEIGAQDPTPFAVVSHHEQNVLIDGFRRRVLIIESGWYETEDQARCAAHSIEFPEH